MSIDESEKENEISVNENSVNEIAVNEIAMNEISANEISAIEISAMEISAMEISANEISANGISANGISANGISANGISANGISANGISANGISANGISANGISANGISANKIEVNEILVNEIEVIEKENESKKKESEVIEKEKINESKKEKENESKIEKVPPTINSLPDEVVAIILESPQLPTKDVINFGSTCKRFYVIAHDQMIWKTKLNFELAGDARVINSQSPSDWFGELKEYLTMKNFIYKEIANMTTKFFKQDIQIKLKDVEQFFRLASARNINYYLVTSILCGIVKKGNVNMDPNSKEGYNLTIMYYAKLVLRYLIQTFLMLDWVLGYKLQELTPKRVILFFHQWVDTVEIHLKDDFDQEIQKFVKAVEANLEANHPYMDTTQSKRDFWASDKCVLTNNMWGKIHCRLIFTAIRLVLYTDMGENLIDNLNIETGVGKHVGRTTLMAALYAILSQCFGVRCDLVTFADHMFLEWKEDYEDPYTEVFRINLTNGEVEKKKSCPFSGNNRSTSYKYTPDHFLTHLYGFYVRSQGPIRNWSTENVYCMYDFLKTDHTMEDTGPYKNYLLFLMNADQKFLTTPLSFTDMQKIHLDTIFLLVNMHRSKWTDANLITPQPHISDVKFAIGMQCFHKKYEYVCVIRSWDKECTASQEWQERMAVPSLEFGAKQPFYQVVSADYSERYVAQEQLIKYPMPSRLEHLEDVLAAEYTHFDGFAYIPNAMKNSEYPEDGPIREMYRSRHFDNP